MHRASGPGDQPPGSAWAVIGWVAKGRVLARFHGEQRRFGNRWRTDKAVVPPHPVVHQPAGGLDDDVSIRATVVTERGTTPALGGGFPGGHAAGAPAVGNVAGAWGEVGYAEDVLDALVGGHTELTPEARWVVGAMEMLADVLADEPDGSVRTVARAMANRVLKLGVKVKTEDGQSPYEVLSETFGWYLGVDVTYGWDATLATAEGWRIVPPPGSRKSPRGASGRPRPQRSLPWCCTTPAQARPRRPAAARTLPDRDRREPGNRPPFFDGGAVILPERRCSARAG